MAPLMFADGYPGLFVNLQCARDPPEITRTYPGRRHRIDPFQLLEEPFHALLIRHPEQPCANLSRRPRRVENPSLNCPEIETTAADDQCGPAALDDVVN